MGQRGLTWLALVAGAVLFAISSLSAAEINHRFLALDESRGQMLYVDQSDASKGWTLKLPVKHRDLQLVGGNRVLLSPPDGYREYDLADRRLVKEVKGYAGLPQSQRSGLTQWLAAAKGLRRTEFNFAGETW